MKTIISWIIVVVIIIGGVILLSNNQNGSSNKNGGEKSSSSLAVDRVAHDFGKIGIFDGKVETDFTLTNNGMDKIVILAGTTSCGCTEGSIDGVKFGMHKGISRSISIEPGGSRVLTAIYDPLAHGPNGTGQATRQLFIKTNSTETPELEVKIFANVVRKVN